MTTIHPPRFVARLLKRLVPAQDHDALLGDLCEEYQRRRSKAWYFLQILAAIIVGSLKNVRKHWLLTLRAIAIGVAAFLAYFYVVGVLVLNNIHLSPVSYAGAWFFIQLFFHLGLATSGWAIGRFHRAYGIAMVLPFAALLGAMSFADFAGSALKLQSWTVVEMFKLFGMLTKSISFPAAIFLGGYFATRRGEAA